MSGGALLCGALPLVPWGVCKVDNFFVYFFLALQVS